MGTLYLKTAGGNFNGANWSTTSAGGVDSNTPTAADDCIMELLSGACTINSGSVCRSLNLNSGVSGYNNTITHTAGVTLTIGDGTAGAGSIALDFSGVGGSFAYTLGNTVSSAISFISTSATVQAVNFNAKRTGSVTFNAASNGSWQLTGNIDASAPSGDTVLTLTKGTLDTNGQTVYCGHFICNSGSTRVLTLGASTINIGTSTTSPSFNASNVTGLTVTANTATFTFTGSSLPIINSATFNYNGLSLSFTGGTVSFSAADSTFNAVTYTGSNSKLNTFTFNGNPTITTLTVNGNSVINRPFVNSSVLGTARTLTVGTITTKWTDWQDITAAGAANWDLTAQATDSSGDAGGNTGITFTTQTTQTSTGTASFTYSTHGWTSRVPLPQDTVVISNAFVAGRTITVDMPRLGKSVNCSTCTGTPTFALGSGLQPTIFGSLNLTGTVISGTSTFNFQNRSNATLTNGGTTWLGRLQISCFGSKVTLADSLISTATVALGINITNGEFNDGGFTVTTNSVISSSGFTRAITKSATWTFTGVGVIWSVTSGGLTIADTGTVFFNDTSASSKTFAGGGFTYNDLKFAAGSGQMIITGANTFNRIYTDGAGTLPIVLPGSTTTTIISGLGLANGTNVITFTASAGSATVSKSGGGTVSWDYVSLTNIPAVQATTWYAGTHSTDGGGNTNWVFTAPPSGFTVTPLMHMMGISGGLM